MSASANSLPNNPINQWLWIPLLTPAIKENSCEIDYSLLSSRADKVAIAAMATMTFSVLFCPSFPITVTVIIISNLIMNNLPKLDYWIAERAAVVKAVDQYLNMPRPSQFATKLIRNNFKAAQLLISKNGDVNKVNETGDRLLNNICNLDVFKLLIDNGADTKNPNRLGFSCLEQVVYFGNPDYLEYILTNTKVEPENFNSQQQLFLWQNLGSVQAGKLLKEYKFDINIKDDEGYTALLRLTQKTNEFCLYFSLNEYNLQIRRLLDLGADPSITINVDGQEKKAIEITNNQSTRKIFQQFNFSP